MALTQQRGTQIRDGSIQRSDLDTTTAGEAVIRKVLPGNTMFAASTGVDAGTGDVTLHTLDGCPGKTVNYTNNKPSSIQFYTDAAKTALFRTLVLGWTGDNLTTIEVRNAANALLETKTIAYDGSNNLTGAVIS